MYIDTHTHLNFKAFEHDWKEIIEDAIKNKVTHCIVVGTDSISSQKAVDIANEFDNVYASVGIHPHHVKSFLNHPNSNSMIVEQVTALAKLAQNPKVVAIGEVGLDYHYYKHSKYSLTQTQEETKQLVNLQKQLLDQQILLADSLQLPLIIHSREAKQEVLDMIKQHQVTGRNIRGVFHCFDGSKKYAKKIIDSGFHISFTGNITRDLGRQEVAKSIPLDRLLIETDAPYMVPQGVDSKRNTPTNVTIIAESHARLRNTNQAQIAKQTTLNALKLFAIN